MHAPVELADRLGWQLTLSAIYRIQPGVFLYSLFTGYTFLLCMFLDPIILNNLLKRPDGDHSADANSVLYSVCLVLALSLSNLHLLLLVPWRRPDLDGLPTPTLLLRAGTRCVHQGDRGHRLWSR